MNLRAKTILAVYLAVLLLMALLYGLLRSRTVQDYEELEERLLVDQISQARRNLEGQRLDLLRSVQDWTNLVSAISGDAGAEWDGELVDQVGRSDAMDFVLVTDAQGALQYANSHETQLNERWMASLQVSLLSRLKTTEAQAISGSLVLNSDPYAVAAQPVKMDADGRRGWLVVGRLLRPESVLLQGHASTQELILDAAPKRMIVPQQAADVAVVEVDGDTLMGQAIMLDPWGGESVRLSLISTRAVRTQARQSVSYVMAALAITGLAIALAVYISLEIFVIRRLYRLRRRLGEIRELDDLSDRIETTGSDEISKLTESLNTMLGTLARSRVKLTASEDRYRGMVETAQEGIWFIGLDGATQFANERLCDMLGADPQSMRKRLANHWVTRESQATFRKLLAAGPDRVPPTDLQLRRMDGGELWTIATASTTQDASIDDSNAHPDGVMLMLTDITERKQQERHVEAQAALLDQTRDAIIVTTTTGQILSWNHGAQLLYGHRFDAIHERRLDDLLVTREGPTPADLRDAVLRDGNWSGELQQAGAGGQTVTVLARWTRVTNWLGHDQALLIVCTDLSEQKRLEQQIMRSQRLESIGTLAGGIAHDLNNILAPILSTVWLIRRKQPDALPERAIDTIERSAKRGVEIVKQVLAFARGGDGERKTQSPRPLLTELHGIVRNTVDRRITVRFDIPDDLWSINADATQLHQVLLNLCVNARDAMPEGGTLTVAAANRRLDAAAAAKYHDAKPGPYLRISVADTGSGIPPELIDKIFDPFFTTKDVGKGTGLGLSTVVSITQRHGGFLALDSAPGQGTTFRLFFPAEPDAISGHDGLAQEQASVELRPGRGQTILVVDDEPDIRDTTRELLETHGYSVITAENGAEAVAIYGKRKGEIALVITDMNMPVMDGAATINAIADMNSRVNIIAVSGAASAEDVRTQRPNVRAFLRRPYEPLNLLLLCSRWVD